MAEPHVIELALDLARMPALARSSVVPPLPPNIIELIRIAAASPEACQAAVAQTGEPAAVVIEAARFYLQQVLFRPDADCYRILGIKPAASRATARDHMRWLQEWLHPDRNNNSWDAVYAERVLRAWREVSAGNGSTVKPTPPVAHVSSNKRKKRRSQAIRLPWIERPVEGRSLAIPYRAFILLAVPTGLVIIFLAWWSVNVLLQP
ncbi:MAG: hypothetical protein WBE14_12500 [Xanthobacteraceae bacterium]